MQAVLPCSAGLPQVPACSSCCALPPAHQPVSSFELHSSTKASARLSWGSLGCIPDTSWVAASFLFVTGKRTNVCDGKWLLKTLRFTVSGATPELLWLSYRNTISPLVDHPPAFLPPLSHPSFYLTNFSFSVWAPLSAQPPFWISLYSHGLCLLLCGKRWGWERGRRAQGLTEKEGSTSLEPFLPGVTHFRSLSKITQGNPHIFNTVLSWSNCSMNISPVLYIL